MTQLVLDNLEVIRNNLVSESCKVLHSPSIQFSALKLIDKCFSEDHSIFTKAKNTYLGITKSGLFDDANHIKYVLQQGSIKVKYEYEIFQKHIQNIEEACYQFEKPHPITARERSQHIVECSGMF